MIAVDCNVGSYWNIHQGSQISWNNIQGIFKDFEGF